MSNNDRNMRLFLQTQAGQREINGAVNAQVQIPGEYVSRSVVFGNHTIARDSVLVVKSQSNKPYRYYDPSHDGHPLIASKNDEQVPVVDENVIQKAEAVEEENLQGFAVREQIGNVNPFADIGIIYEDENQLADEEDDQTPHDKSNAELNASNVVDPSQVYEDLSAKGPKNFGISKEELASLRLTVGKIKALYQEVVGKAPQSAMGTAKMKKRVRDVASQSYADYTRVMTAIKKITGN